MTEERSPADKRALSIFWVLSGLAVTAALAASVAGVLLWFIDPTPGSATESALGFTAAISGLSTGALFGAAAIYAQIKNLWRFAPMWFRYLAWAVLIAAAVIAAVIAATNSRSG